MLEYIKQSILQNQDENWNREQMENYMKIMNMKKFFIFSFFPLKIVSNSKEVLPRYIDKVYINDHLGKKLILKTKTNWFAILYQRGEDTSVYALATPNYMHLLQFLRGAGEKICFEVVLLKLQVDRLPIAENDEFFVYTPNFLPTELYIKLFKIIQSQEIRTFPYRVCHF